MGTIYLDACCLNRPFDDQSQDRIHLESEAVLLILNGVQQGEFSWCSSSVLEVELIRIPDAERRRRVRAMLGVATSIVALGADEIIRGQELQGLGIKAADALHLACAEAAGCDVFLTTDDRLLRAARNHVDKIRVAVRNPVDWLNEVRSP